jgi:hypothetical protein
MGLSVVAVIVMTACGKVTWQTAPPPSPSGTTTTGPNPSPEKPQVITPEELVTNLSDGTPESFERWSNKLLQVSGVVSGHMTSAMIGDKRFIGVDIKVPITEKKSGKKQDWTLSCFVAKPLQPGDPNIAKYDVGKTVTFRCTLSARSGKIISVKDCELVE